MGICTHLWTTLSNILGPRKSAGPGPAGKHLSFLGQRGILSGVPGGHGGQISRDEGKDPAPVGAASCFTPGACLHLGLWAVTGTAGWA